MTEASEGDQQDVDTQLPEFLDFPERSVDIENITRLQRFSSNPDRDAKIAGYTINRNKQTDKISSQTNILRKELDDAFEEIGFSTLPNNQKPSIASVEKFVSHNLKGSLWVEKDTYKFEEKVVISGHVDKVVFRPTRTLETDLVRYLTHNNVDFETPNIDSFSTLLEHYTRFSKEMGELHVSNQNVLVNFRSESEKLFLDELALRFSDVCSKLSTFENNESYNQKVTEYHNLLNTLALLKGTHEEFRTKLGKSHETLVATKAKLPKQGQILLNNVFEKSEREVFQSYGYGLWEIYSKDDKLTDAEAIMRKVFGLTLEEVKEKRVRNFGHTRSYIVNLPEKTSKLNLDVIRTIHKLSTKGVLPFFMQGIRYDQHGEPYSIYGNKKEARIKSKDKIVDAPSRAELDNLLKPLISKMNEQIADKKSRGFQRKMASLVAEYWHIHPHADGNGTAGLFIVEAAKSLRNPNYVPPKSYNLDFRKRAFQVLGPTNTALAKMKSP